MALQRGAVRLTQQSCGRTNADWIVAGLTELRELWLNYTEVTDAGLAHLAGLTKLQKLSLRGTKVTDAGMAKLRKALPTCEIIGP